MIKVEKLSFSYNGNYVINDINFIAKRGEFVGILGPNGAGKSTLLKLIDRLIIPQSGNIYIEERLIKNFSRKELAQKIAFVQQDFKTAFNFTVLDIVLMGRYPHQESYFTYNKHDKEIVVKAMEATDCEHLMSRDFYSLSGGERQRVVLASALAQEPDILLLDEPTTALDLKHQIHFYKIIRKLQSENNMTILNVTHDINLLIQFCDRFIIIKDGHVVSDGGIADIIRKEILQEVYGTSLEMIIHPQSKRPVVLPTFY
jgi:iron complex transport system ATP-binding protein